MNPIRGVRLKKPKAEEEEQKSDEEDVGSSSFFSLDTLGNDNRFDVIDANCY